MSPPAPVTEKVLLVASRKPLYPFPAPVSEIYEGRLPLTVIVSALPVPQVNISHRVLLFPPKPVSVPPLKVSGPSWLLL